MKAFALIRNKSFAVSIFSRMLFLPGIIFDVAFF
jgi:hypothetical protein